jgi:hypothetical protein
MDSFSMMADYEFTERGERLRESYNHSVFIDEFGETNLRQPTLPEPEPPTDEWLWEYEENRRAMAHLHCLMNAPLCPAYIKERFAKPESGEPK